MVVNPRVLVVGSANQDLTCVTHQFPIPGETVLGDSFTTSPGGKGANQARAAAVLSDNVHFVTALGQDSLADALRQALAQVGLDDTVVVPTVSTGVASILVDAATGNNRIVVVPGANHALTAEAVTAAVERQRPTVVVAQLEIPLAAVRAAMTAGSRVGAVTMLNPAPAVSVLEDELLAQTDVLLPNESELRTLCGVSTDDLEDDAVAASTDVEEELARKLLDRGVRIAVLVTLGARGALFVPRDGPSQHLRPNVVVDKVVDTIGAGDAVCGALAAHVAATVPSVDWASAVTKACSLATLSVQLRGATYPLRSDLPPDLLLPSTSTSPSDAKPSLTFVTGNAKKLKEVQEILGNAGSVSITNHKLDLPELQGDPEDIAREKCRLAAEQITGNCMIEDTSLCFDALGGLPGPYIKWFLDKCGHDGLNRMLAGFDGNTSAYAQTIVALQWEGTIHVFDGKTEGKIVPARGDNKFGWDPIFEPNEGGGKTYAEMESAEKHAISHRGRAFAKVRAFLADQA